MNKRGAFGIVMLVLAMLCIPGFFIMQTYGLFQKEKVLSDYAIAVDVDGKSYQTWPLINGFAAMDKQDEDRQFYYRIDMSGLEYLFQLAYKEYEVEPGGDNPFLAGQVNYMYTDHQYVRSENKYTNAKDFVTVLTLVDRAGNIIYTYEQTGKGDKNLIKSIIHQGMSRTSNRGTEAARDPYLNITALFREKLGINVKLEVDEEHKIVTIRMDKMEEK
ncbi:hypothetical protein PAECIP112173_01629 [Paenibacillus sp. JJ-100]|uniref:hypothetical protein n=1 Tax=Paenibacillus sp. JJ-100 TaxID=2974896 RepID=UPI0022FF7A28|nr:hypothetical protein [Paenibacillus sp. JJ-100]CAI6056964.1 hypothetical protein PAECIP112173_01629 [Paenibacillus sp. JJ-100]